MKFLRVLSHSFAAFAGLFLVFATTGRATAAPALVPAATGLVLVTRAVAEVADRVVTSREVRMSDAIEQAMTGKSPGTDGFRVLTGVEKNFPGEVTATLDEWIVYLEAKSLSSSPPSKTDLAAAVKGVQEFWAGKPAWLALEVSADELRDIVERKLIAKDFERLKADPELTPVSDDDALSYFRKNRLRFGSLPFSTFKDSIKTFLVKSQTDRRLAEWRDVLRRKYRARNFIAG
jgi:hypothetical protein